MATKPVLADYSGKLKELASGDVITPLNLGSGLPSATTFLRGDNTWATPAGGSGSGITRSIINITTATTGAAIVNVDYVYIAVGTFSYTQPTAIGNTNRYTIINNSTGAITLLFTSGQTINGLTSLVLYSGDSVDIISDNANWLIIG